MYLIGEAGFRNEKLLKTMGFTLRKYRKGSFTQKELAKEAGISANYLRDIEKGRKSVSVEILYRICMVLGIGMTDFFQQVEQLMSQDKELLFL